MSRAAYAWAVGVSVYLDHARHRTGGGRALYEALFERLAARGHRMALAGVGLPNEASVGLHRALGFELVGTYRRVGWKLGRWHDVAWYQRALADGDGPPTPLR
jgi:phosphinothricin acetyltransferase